MKGLSVCVQLTVNSSVCLAQVSFAQGHIYSSHHLNDASFVNSRWPPPSFRESLVPTSRRLDYPAVQQKNAHWTNGRLLRATPHWERGTPTMKNKHTRRLWGISDSSSFLSLAPVAAGEKVRKSHGVQTKARVYIHKQPQGWEHKEQEPKVFSDIKTCAFNLQKVQINFLKLVRSKELEAACIWSK